MRLFIAILLNDEVKSALKDAQNQMYEGCVYGNYAPEENLHLTLAFIGEYPDPDEVLEALDTVSFTPFELSLKGTGNFGDIWWAGLEDSLELQAVVRRLRRALSDHQIPFDRKSFRPHITLIRKARLKQGVPAISMQETSMKVEAISLMRSDRGKNGMIYTEIGVLKAD